VLNNPIGRLRLIGLLEGSSFLILLGIAMPLKYAAGMPLAVKYVGWAHGALFLLFILALGQAAAETDWGFKRSQEPSSPPSSPLAPSCSTGNGSRTRQPCSPPLARVSPPPRGRDSLPLA
jgi:integral membrane protein